MTDMERIICEAAVQQGKRVCVEVDGLRMMADGTLVPYTATTTHDPSDLLDHGKPDHWYVMGTWV